jgi:phospholipid/cholesterol/gamma-HCH transport system substrate-binding protein
MIKEKSHNVRLGIFVFSGLVLLIVGLYSIGRNKNMFGESYHLYSTFYNVNGLVPGDNVRYAGIDIGTVDKIEIVNDSAVKVEMIIDVNIIKFIRKNSITSIGTDGLMGNKLVNISPGSVNSPSVRQNDELYSERSVNTEAMLRTLDVTNENIYVISSNLRSITDNFSQSRGALYTIMNDTTISGHIGISLNNIEQVSNNLVSVSAQLQGMMSNVNSGKGLLGLLVSDTAVSNDLKVSVDKIRIGSEQFSKITTDVSLTLKEINSGQGAVTTLLKDTAMAGDLKTSVSNLEKASYTLNEELEALKHSFLLRNFYKDKK